MNGVTVHGTKYNDESLWTINGLTLPNKYEIELTASNLQGQGTGILLGDSILVDLDVSAPRLNIYKLQNGSYTQISTTTVTYLNTNLLKVRVELGALKVYLNDNLITTVNYTPNGSFKYRSYGNNRYTTFKDLTIQEL